MKEWIGRIRQFLAEVSVELKRTTWPSAVEVRGTTIVVIVTVFIFSLFLFTVDQGLSQAVKYIFQRMR